VSDLPVLADPATRLEARAARLAEIVDDIKASADMVVAGTLRQQEALKQISGAADGITRTIKVTAGNVGSLSSSSDETSSSILAMVASIEEVAGHADGPMSVNETTSTTEEVVASIKEIDRNVELLNRFVTETSGAIARMGGTIRQVEHNAADGRQISELVAKNAETGMRAVELTMEAMETIRGGVQEAGRVIESVGRRGQEIDLILNVIQEVTEQTNLLALNAAIIAAQAGTAAVSRSWRGDPQLAERRHQRQGDRRPDRVFQADTRAVRHGEAAARRGGQRPVARGGPALGDPSRRGAPPPWSGEIADATRERAREPADRRRGRQGRRWWAAAGDRRRASARADPSAVENMREMAT
jgi:hypothetical protein